MRPVALYKIQRRRKNKGQKTRPAIITPIAVVFAAGRFQVAMMNVNGELEWVHYDEAVRRLTILNFKNFSNLHSWYDICLSQSGFFAEVLNSLDRDMETIIYVDAENLRSIIPALSNEQMVLGQCEVRHPNGPAFACSLQNRNEHTSLVRVSANVDKQPSYTFPNDDTQQTITGIFQEPEHHMTFWEVREKPNSMQTLSRFMPVSRHPSLQALLPNNEELEDSNPPDEERRMRAEIAADRAAPILDEITIVYHSEMFLPFDLTQITRKLRKAHIAYSDQTRLPFPLHEASKLANAIK